MIIFLITFLLILYTSFKLFCTTNYQISYLTTHFICFYQATVPVEINQALNIRLSKHQVSYFKFEVPSEGISITLRGLRGQVMLFASYRTRNPNSALHDYAIKNDGEIYIGSSRTHGRTRFQRGEVVLSSQSNATLYASVEGTGLDNDFIVWSSKGDRVRSKHLLIHNYWEG